MDYFFIFHLSIGLLFFLGANQLKLTGAFQEWGEKIIGPLLILIGLFMLNLIKISIPGFGKMNEKIEEKSRKGFGGVLLLGVVFALAFCPYSGVLFFGILIPLILSTTEGLLLPPLFALGTGLPVIVFSFLIAFSIERVSQAFKAVQKVEQVMRYLVASVFMITGLYYFYILLKFFYYL